MIILPSYHNMQRNMALNDVENMGAPSCVPRSPVHSSLIYSAAVMSGVKGRQ